MVRNDALVIIDLETTVGAVEGEIAKLIPIGLSVICPRIKKKNVIIILATFDKNNKISAEVC